jgi:hypothetical protein
MTIYRTADTYRAWTPARFRQSSPSMVLVRVRKRSGIHQFIDVSDEISQFLTSPRNSAIYIIFQSIGKPDRICRQSERKSP